MTDSSTRGKMAELLELALNAERAAQNLYRQLEEMFTHLPEVAQLWRQMAQDEAAHVAQLEKIRASLSREQLLAPVEPSVLEKARYHARFAAEDELAAIRSAEEAYQLAHSLEHSEVNTVFEFILTELLAPEAQRQFVTSQIEEHVARLEAFPRIALHGDVDPSH